VVVPDKLTDDAVGTPELLICPLALLNTAAPVETLDTGVTSNLI